MKKRSSLWLLPSLMVALCTSIGFSNAFSDASATPAPMLRTALAPFDTKQVYESKCASCHGRDGRAKSLHAKHVHARDLTDAAWQADVSDERLFNSISNGKGKMPAFKTKLAEDQIDALVHYVRQLKK